MAYWVYLHGGNETENQEWALYYFYFQVYKIHRMFGAGQHDYDRRRDPDFGMYDGDEPKK